MTSTTILYKHHNILLASLHYIVLKWDSIALENTFQAKDSMQSLSITRWLLVICSIILYMILYTYILYSWSSEFWYKVRGQQLYLGGEQLFIFSLSCFFVLDCQFSFYSPDGLQKLPWGIGDFSCTLVAEGNN